MKASNNDLLSDLFMEGKPDPKAKAPKTPAGTMGKKQNKKTVSLLAQSPKPNSPDSMDGQFLHVGLSVSRWVLSSGTP